MRVVLDTNILISACWKPGGNESRVVAMVRAGELTACVSAAVVEEYREVSLRRKFAKQRECLGEMIAVLVARAVRVEPAAVCEACGDPDDNQLLDCAAAAGAAFVVTGNLRHFPSEWEGVVVTNARGLLDAVSRRS